MRITPQTIGKGFKFITRNSLHHDTNVGRYLEAIGSWGKQMH